MAGARAPRRARRRRRIRGARKDPAAIGQLPDRDPSRPRPLDKKVLAAIPTVASTNGQSPPGSDRQEPRERRKRRRAPRQRAVAPNRGGSAWRRTMAIPSRAGEPKLTAQA